MKPSTASIILGLAATGLAAPSPNNDNIAARQNTQSNVLIAKGYNLQGDQFTMTVTYGVCSPVTPGFERQISSIAPNADLRCVLYDASNCQGRASAPIVGRVNDLRVPPYNFDNLAVSLNCTRI